MGTPMNNTEIITTNQNFGLFKIDEQHMELFHLMNRLFDACNHGKGREEIGHVFEFLNNYIMHHFNTEEEYMNKYNYPRSSNHKEIHRNFKNDFAELKKKLGRSFNELSILEETNWLLGEWWINHINKVDKELGTFLKSKGAH